MLTEEGREIPNLAADVGTKHILIKANEILWIHKNEAMNQSFAERAGGQKYKDKCQNKSREFKTLHRIKSDAEKLYWRLAIQEKKMLYILT